MIRFSGDEYAPDKRVSNGHLPCVQTELEADRIDDDVDHLLRLVYAFAVAEVEFGCEIGPFITVQFVQLPLDSDRKADAARSFRLIFAIFYYLYQSTGIIGINLLDILYKRTIR